MERYGEWLVLYSIPGYLALSDLGVGAVAANRICMLSAAGRNDEAKVVLRTTWVFLILVCLALSVVVISSALLIDWAHLLSLKIISRIEAEWSLIALGMMVVFSLPGSIIGGLYRAGYQNARGVVIANTWRLAQLGTIALLAPLTKSLAWISCGLLIVQILALGFQLFDVRRFVSHIGLFGSRLEWGELKAMWKPSLSYMLFPIANSIYLQGGTLVVNSFLGPSFVVLFNTSRTLTRVLSQGVTIIRQTLWPEFSHLYGIGEMSKVKRLYFLGIEFSVILTTLGSLVIILLAKPLMTMWTHGAVTCDYKLLGILSLTTIINGFWVAGSALILATNKHALYSIVYCISCAVSLGLSVILSPVMGVLAVPIAMVFVEFVTGVATLISGGRLLNEKALHIILRILSFKEIYHLKKQISTKATKSLRFVINSEQ